MGDVDGDGQDDAYFRVYCTNGGGTGEGIFGSADVIVASTQPLNGSRGKPLRILGIITPQQPITLIDGVLGTIPQRSPSLRLWPRSLPEAITSGGVRTLV